MSEISAFFCNEKIFAHELHTFRQRWTDWYGCDWCMLFFVQYVWKNRSTLQPVHTQGTQDVAYSFISWIWKLNLDVKKKKILTAAVSRRSMKTDYEADRRQAGCKWIKLEADSSAHLTLASFHLSLSVSHPNSLFNISFKFCRICCRYILP